MKGLGSSRAEWEAEKKKEEDASVQQFASSNAKMFIAEMVQHKYRTKAELAKLSPMALMQLHAQMANEEQENEEKKKAEKEKKKVAPGKGKSKGPPPPKPKKQTLSVEARAEIDEGLLELKAESDKYFSDHPAEFSPRDVTVTALLARGQENYISWESPPKSRIARWEYSQELGYFFLFREKGEIRKLRIEDLKLLDSLDLFDFGRLPLYNPSNFQRAYEVQYFYRTRCANAKAEEMIRQRARRAALRKKIDDGLVASPSNLYNLKPTSAEAEIESWTFHPLKKIFIFRKRDASAFSKSFPELEELSDKDIRELQDKEIEAVETIPTVRRAVTYVKERFSKLQKSSAGGPSV